MSSKLFGLSQIGVTGTMSRQDPGLEVCDSFLVEKFESLRLVSKFRVDWVADSGM